MKYTATANVKNKITASAEIKEKITVSVSYKTLTPIEACPQYNLLDGGNASQVYTPINGFDLISGGF